MSDDFLFDADLLAEALLEEGGETDDEKLVRWSKGIADAPNSQELYSYMTESLPISGQRFGSSLSMNRAIAFLKNEKLLDDKCPTWASCKKDHKETIAMSFASALPDTGRLRNLKMAVLEGFLPPRSKIINNCFWTTTMKPHRFSQVDVLLIGLLYWPVP